MATGARERAMVFISHDSRDAILAQAFGDLLRAASGGYLSYFCSSERDGMRGIDYGVKWHDTIMRELDKATEVVAILTRQSLNHSWIHHEIGVANGRPGKRIIGLALGISIEEVQGPLGLFQNCPNDEAQLVCLVLQLVRSDPEANPSEKDVKRCVKEFRKKVARFLTSREGAEEPGGDAGNELPVAKMTTGMEDVLDKIVDNLNQLIKARSEKAVQDLQEQIQDAVAQAGEELRNICSQHQSPASKAGKGKRKCPR